VTDPIAQLKNLAAPYGTGLSYSDLSHEDQRLVKIGGIAAAALLWFAVALVQPWFLLAVPVLGAGIAWIVRERRKANPEGSAGDDDWSF
jgi:hypothetical protein